MEQDDSLTTRLADAARAWAVVEGVLGQIDLRFDVASGTRMMRNLDQLLELQDAEDAAPPHGLARLICFVTDWVERYDAANVQMPDLVPADLLRHLIKSNNLRQRDLAPLMGGQSCVSDVLRGKRDININQARALGKRFSLKVSAFFPAIDDDEDVVTRAVTGVGFHSFPFGVTSPTSANNSSVTYVDPSALH
ncbi:MAG: hypothetical protein EOP39_04265 [Rubrivivax sp.]|nr:MAG: hypothetical protein EOP39_04265 [Rubrivivax sp.]